MSLLTIAFLSLSSLSSLSVVVLSKCGNILSSRYDLVMFNVFAVSFSNISLYEASNILSIPPFIPNVLIFIVFIDSSPFGISILSLVSVDEVSALISDEDVSSYSIITEALLHNFVITVLL